MGSGCKKSIGERGVRLVLSGTKARGTLHEKHGGGGTLVPTQDPDGGWQITCPDCDTIHRSADRLCPLCTQKSVHALRVSNRRLMEQNSSLRDLMTEVRHELFKCWHQEAVADGAKSPVTDVEKRWSQFLKTSS